MDRESPRSIDLADLRRGTSYFVWGNNKPNRPVRRSIMCVWRRLSSGRCAETQQGRGAEARGSRQAACVKGCAETNAAGPCCFYVFSNSWRQQIRPKMWQRHSLTAVRLGSTDARDPGDHHHSTGEGDSRNMQRACGRVGGLSSLFFLLCVALVFFYQIHNIHRLAASRYHQC